jgi:hypothetical protein
MTFQPGPASGFEGATISNYLCASLHLWNSSQALHSIYFSPSLVYLATTLEVCVRSDMRYFPIDRRLASRCSWHNPDDIWSADTNNYPS